MVLTAFIANCISLMCFQKYSNQAISKRSNDCVPYTMTEERVLLYNTFILEMEKVLTCQKVPSTCQRLPRMVTYYPGTAFARTIDVGACGGECGDEVVCLPTKNRTTAISTPNGTRSTQYAIYTLPFASVRLCSLLKEQ